MDAVAQLLDCFVFIHNDKCMYEKWKPDAGIIYRIHRQFYYNKYDIQWRMVVFICVYFTCIDVCVYLNAAIKFHHGCS